MGIQEALQAMESGRFKGLAKTVPKTLTDEDIQDIGNYKNLEFERGFIKFPLKVSTCCADGGKGGLRDRP